MAGAGVPRRRRRAGRGRDPRGHRRQPLPLHGLHEDHRGDRDRRWRTETKDDDELDDASADAAVDARRGDNDEELDDAAVDAHAAIDNEEEPTADSPTDAEYTVAFSPRQLAGGFAIIAALIILIARRRRKKSRSAVPVEPPIDTPRPLDEAHAILAESRAATPSRPIAGGTDLMVRITGEIGEPPARMLDLWRLDELRGIARTAALW